MKTRRPHTSSTGRAYGPQEVYTVRGTYADPHTQAKIAAALAEELSEDWKDFYDSPDRRRRNMLRSLQGSRTV
jgi:hypothetical protein